MQIHQLQIVPDVVQDRLLLRVSTQANEEFRVWFTRRYLRELWPLLSRMLAGHLAPKTAMGADTDAPPAENAGPTFGEPFQASNPLYPLGVTPLLASEGTLETAGEGLARLIFREGRERSFSLNLNTDLLQSLCALLRAGAEQASWDLTLDYRKPAGLPGSATLPEGNSRQLLH